MKQLLHSRTAATYRPSRHGAPAMRCGPVVLALIACIASSQVAVGQYYDDYPGDFNLTDIDDGAGVAGRGQTHRTPGDPVVLPYAYPNVDEAAPQVWSTRLDDGGDAAAGAAAADPAAGAAGPAGGPAAGKARVFARGAASQRHAGMSASKSATCADGSCTNPDLDSSYASDLDAYYDPYGPVDLHYDPRYPYDNCHWVGAGFDQFVLNGTETCSLLVQGVDGHADRLAGGLDGTYILAGCFEGKPVYLRSRSSGPEGEDRALYYNSNFGQWEFAVGREPSVDHMVLYGDEGHVSPIDVPRWRLAAAFNSDQAALLPSDDEELYFVAPGVSVMCADEGDAALMWDGVSAILAGADGKPEGVGRKGRDGKGGGKSAGKQGGKGKGEGRRKGKGKGGGGKGGEAEGEAEGERAKEIRETREYWQQHEEDFYEQLYEQYGAAYGAYDEGMYDDGYGGLY